MNSLTKNWKAYKETGKYGPFGGKKKRNQEKLALRKPRLSDSLEEDLNILKELTEIMDKELKETKGTISQQKQMINKRDRNY